MFTYLTNVFCLVYCTSETFTSSTSYACKKALNVSSFLFRNVGFVQKSFLKLSLLTHVAGSKRIYNLIPTKTCPRHFSIYIFSTERSNQSHYLLHTYSSQPGLLFSLCTCICTNEFFRDWIEIWTCDLVLMSRLNRNMVNDTKDIPKYDEITSELASKTDRTCIHT
jgi:hypothetical protein